MVKGPSEGWESLAGDEDGSSRRRPLRGRGGERDQMGAALFWGGRACEFALVLGRD